MPVAGQVVMRCRQSTADPSPELGSFSISAHNTAFAFKLGLPEIFQTLTVIFPTPTPADKPPLPGRESTPSSHFQNARGPIPVPCRVPSSKPSVPTGQPNNVKTHPSSHPTQVHPNTLRFPTPTESITRYLDNPSYFFPVPTTDQPAIQEPRRNDNGNHL